MQAAIKELRVLKQEEATLVTMASKIGDQLNRLKVEELALQNLARIQNEEQEMELRASSNASLARSLESENQGRELNEEAQENRVVPLNLVVNSHHMGQGWGQGMEEEEEEEDEEEVMKGTAGRDIKLEVKVHDDLEEFVDDLT